MGIRVDPLPEATALSVPVRTARGQWDLCINATCVSLNIDEGGTHVATYEVLRVARRTFSLTAFPGGA
jgi:hypothetical protein